MKIKLGILEIDLSDQFLARLMETIINDFPKNQ